MAQITCEAAADTQSQIWGTDIRRERQTAVCLSGRSDVYPPPFVRPAYSHIYIYICAILPRVQPYVATDLYIGTVRRRPVAMAPSVADAGGEDERLAS